VNESKADVEGMADQNGRADSDRFNVVADQIKPAAAQSRAGRMETAAESGSVALNQALADTRAVTGAAPPRRLAESVQPPITIPRGNGLNGNRDHDPGSGPDGAIDLVSTVADAPSERRSARAPGAIINLQSAAVETPILRPSKVSKPIIVGSVGARPKEPPSERVGEAFPEQADEGGAMSEPPRISEGTESTLGMFLLASRERHGVKREEAARETRIPGHYLRMMESNDYAMIADQLYLLPFLRRYAEYLGLDSEEIAIRFVREVQRAENSPSPASASISGKTEAAPSNRWAIIGAIAVIALIAVWIILQRHHASADAASPAQSATMPGADAGMDSAASIQAAAPRR
jgi:hypothetical protein